MLEQVNKINANPNIATISIATIKLGIAILYEEN